MPAISQTQVVHRAEPDRPTLWILSWNGLLALRDGLVARARWARRDRAVTWLLSPRPSAVPSARRMTAVRLAAWGLEEHVEVVDVLVCELIGDALRDATAKIRLALWVEDGLLRGEVEDLSPQGPPVPSPPRHNPLLDRLVCCGGATGKIAWFELVTAERDSPHQGMATPD
ncbi:hypothetical protein [Nonomuraea diastatica]|uniref:ATP-binding protein n=1 Tax=Nonomuraea diastatica TaxID=1848329 RepID=A0A4R4W4J5_9ACTN|nr:hypothetical protein [Nonomuraea diastatica]TDD13462.1 hypothetical protein E1294_40900 [Nonomuraea diastatica]